jgi:hypothetical protein
MAANPGTRAELGGAATELADAGAPRRLSIATILALSASIAAMRLSGGLAAHSKTSLSPLRLSFMPADPAPLRIDRVFKVRSSIGRQARQFRSRRQFGCFEALQYDIIYFSIC